MKKRILLLTTLAAMLAAAMALSGVAQAAPISDEADAQCLKLAIQTLGPSYNPGTYTFHGGTETESTGPEINDNFDDEATEGVPEVFCGFSGNDLINQLQQGDIFLGGAGIDRVSNNFGGTFYGGEGDDQVFAFQSGTFYGEEGNDVVFRQFGGTFDGGEGFDQVVSLCGGSITPTVERFSTSGCFPGPGPGPFPGP
jgi:hypothetical protein